MPASFHHLSLREAARLVRARRVSPVELTRAMLARIEALDPFVHAFITVTADSALAQARQAEREIAAGRWRGPLHGIPIAYKDNVETRGVRTTAHSRSLAGHVPPADAAVVRRLDAAGAISLGKLSLQELAYGSPGRDDAFDSPVNPWRLTHSPGGSSSGSGAAVAAGFVYGAVGTDTGGSIRHPAAVCGVVGMKPSFDLVSTEGTIALSPTQDHVGPLTREVGDNAAMLAAMAGSPPREPDPAIDGLRVGVPHDLIEAVGADDCVLAAFESALAVLKSLGASVAAVPTPKLRDFNALGTRIILYEAWARHGAGLSRNPQLYGDAFRTRVMRGAAISRADHLAALQAREAIGRHYRDLFAAGLDVIVSPGREEPAMTMDRLRADPLGVRGQYTRIYNLARIPALVMPMGLSPDGLPLGIQIAGDVGAEARVYDVAAALERELPWTRLHPDLDAQAAAARGEAAHG